MTIEKGRGDAMATKTKVRTTIEPGVVIEVDDSELTDLDRQGLIWASEDGKGRHKWKPEAEDEPVEPAPGQLDEPTDKKKGA